MTKRYSRSPLLLLLLDENVLYQGIDCHTSFKARNDQYVMNYQTKLWPEVGSWDVTITFVKLPQKGSKLVIHYGHNDTSKGARWIERTMNGISHRVSINIPRTGEPWDKT